MADQLTPELAVMFANRLKSIPGFAWDEVVISATAEDLMRWCTGAFIEARMWTAEAQANWLVTEARERWDKWQGTAALRVLFREKFPEAKAEPLPALTRDEAARRGLIAICPRCEGGGYVGQVPNMEYCTCGMGRHQKGWYGDRGLRDINNPPPPPTRPVSGTLQPFTPISFERMEEALREERRRKEEQLARLEREGQV